MVLGNIVLGMLILLAFLILICLLPPIPQLRGKPKTTIRNHQDVDEWAGKQVLQRTSIEYPDDPSHAFAEFRAWDRHLKFWGMSPIFAEDPSKVGPILLGPNDVGKYYLQYDYDDRGYLTLSTYRRGRAEM